MQSSVVQCAVLKSCSDSAQSDLKQPKLVLVSLGPGLKIAQVGATSLGLALKMAQVSGQTGTPAWVHIRLLSVQWHAVQCIV